MKTVILLGFNYNDEGLNYLTYDIEKDKIIVVPSDRDYHPYFLADVNSVIPKSNRIVNIEKIKKYNALAEKEQEYLKINVKEPSDVAYLSKKIKNGIAREHHIYFHLNQAYDKRLVYGCNHILDNGELKLPIHFDGDLFSYYKEIFDQPLYSYKRCAIDIEVKVKKEGEINVFRADNPIIAVSVAGSDGFERIYLLGDKKSVSNRVMIFDDEGDLLRKVYEDISSYPIKLTFYGDTFDFAYMIQRSGMLGVKHPFKGKREWISFKDGSLHLDLARFFMNDAVRKYMFGEKYERGSLDEIARSLWGGRKFERPDFYTQDIMRIGEYCLQDAKLTLEATMFDDETVMNAITMLCRLTNMDMEFVTRKTVSTWVRSTYHYVHRLFNYVIPSAEDFKKINPSQIKGSKHGAYRGAIVLDPAELGTIGTNFDVFGLDFSSLYPMSIVRGNISYETVKCKHPECKDNLIPELGIHICKKRRGILSMLFEAITKLRVNVYKKEMRGYERLIDSMIYNGLADEETIKKMKATLSQLKAIVGMLKVFLVAGYGVFGDKDLTDLFNYYVAAAVPALGRRSLKLAMEEIEKLGGKIVIGHTDGLYVTGVDEKTIKDISKRISEKLGIEFEYGGHYRYVSCYKKANYLVCDDYGRIVVKGLMVKKRNTAPFIKETYNRIKEILSEIYDYEGIEKAKDKIREICMEVREKILKEKIPLPQLVIKVQLGKDPSKVEVLKDGKRGNQYYVCAKLYELELGKKLQKGDVIEMILTNPQKATYKGYGITAMPLEMVLDYSLVDKNKYIEHLENKIGQLLECIGMSMDEAFGRVTHKQIDITRWFG